MYLIGLNLSDAGEFQNEFSRISEPVTFKQLRSLSNKRKLLCMARGEEALAFDVFKKRHHLRIPMFEQGDEVQTGSIVGMIVPVYTHLFLSRYSVREGERTTRRELTRSPIEFRFFRRMTA